ncbi:MAG: acyl-CoA dehydrogenase [Acidimicrobiales bacterium]|nr:acyl-CoA dehydrogenase [Acidimicrobiales bacterium]
MTETVDEFRRELRDWLATTPRPPGLRDYGATPTARDLAAGRAWQAMLADAGWACIAWPVEHGGRAASLGERAAYAEECARAGVPRQLAIVGPDLVGPVLLEHGTDAQRRSLLPSIRTGEHLWCQLFSEPDAGSDLASVRTRARREGGGWVVQGTKVWSSGAAIAEVGLLLARTGDAARELSMFIVPMTAAGIEVHPLRQMDGDAKFNEVVLHEVSVPDDAVIGPVGQGWSLALSTLGSERLTLGAQAVALLAHLESLLPLVGDRYADRMEAVSLLSRIRLLRVGFQRLLATGRPLSDPSFSMLKVWATEIQRDLARFGVGVTGPAAVAYEGDVPNAAAQFLAQPGQTIAGGTSEIQRNILAERVLGLPR